MNTIINTVSIFLLSFLLISCSNSEIEKQATQARIEQAQKEQEAALAQLKNPLIKLIGNFDGCEVKFYERSNYRQDNFYLARCGSTTTITNFNFSNHQYKRRQLESTFSILNVDNSLNVQKPTQEQLSLIQKADKIRAALAKLNDEDKQALGIQ